MIPIQQLPKSPTRKCFEEAFLELYAQKPLDQISVMVLTEKAGYSRATFYRNYYSISNVLESVEEENTCTSTCQAIVSCLDDITLEQATDAMADFYQKRFREVSILANGEYGSIYLDKQREPMKQLFAALLDRGFELSPFQLDVISEYIASAKVGMLRLWVNDPSKITLNHLNKMTENIFKSRLWTYLAKCLSGDGAKQDKIVLPEEFPDYPWMMKWWHAGVAASNCAFLTSSAAAPNSPLRRCCRSLRKDVCCGIQRSRRCRHDRHEVQCHRKGAVRPDFDADMLRLPACRYLQS